MNKHALGSVLCLILWGGVLGLTTAFAQQLKPASPSQTSAQQMNIASTPAAATHAVASLAISPTESLTTAWSHSCVTQHMVITGVGMGDPIQAINPQTMTLTDPNSVAGLWVQVAGRDNDASPVPEWVALTTDTQTLTLTKIYNPPHAYTFEADLQPTRHITALVSNTGNDYKTPRGLILYSLRNTNEAWSSVGKTMGEFIYKRTHTETLILPEPLGQPTDVEVTAVVIDNDNDYRSLALTATAGSAVSTSGAITGPTDGPLLNIIPLTLSQVPTHTDRITITLQSPQQKGDSLVLVGLNVSYPCSGKNADLEITQTVEITTLNESELITYTITVTNHGPSDATGVWVTDTLPAGLVFGGYSATQGIYTDTSGWEVGYLTNTVTATLMITATANECSGTSIVNTAVVTAAIDSNPYNNEATASVNSTVALYCIYLPIIYKEPTVCNPYNFNDSPGGWLIDNEGQVQTGYTSNNDEYFIWRMIPGMRIVQAPIGYSNQYTVEVDVRWGNMGYEYGLIFGQGDSANSLTYRFGVDPSNRRYRLRYGSVNSGWGCVNQSSTPNSGPSCWINFDPPNLVHTGTASNHLKIECDKSTFSLYINDNPHPIEQINNHSCRGRVGIFAQSITYLNTTAYFDNFKVSCSSSGMNSLDVQKDTSPDSTTFAESDYDK